MNGAVVRRFLGIIVAALAFSTSAVAQSSDQPFSKWFKYNSTAAAKWQSIITGVVLLLAAAVDAISRRRAARS